ncbi:hypothetical protein ACHAXR_011521 [Thalassiosira sp. AJA248-18]
MSSPRRPASTRKASDKPHSPIKGRARKKSSNTSQSDGDESTSEGISWRCKCIAQFGLSDVPDGWKDSVAIGSEDAWKRYYEYRILVEGKSGEDSDDDDSYEDGPTTELMKEWTSKMESRIRNSMAENCKWPWKPELGYLTWDYDEPSLISSEYYAHVWSPYAIPHAIKFEHRYHCRSGWSTVSFGTIWNYRLIDFEELGCSIQVEEEETMENNEYITLCSNVYEDEEFRADVIQDKHLNKTTGNKLRTFLFGTHSEDSKAVTCSDINFWLLIFGSMGTTDPDLAKDPMRGHHGYEWQPYRIEETKKKLYELKAVEGDDPDQGDPYGPLEDYYPDGCSWLKYKVLKITGNLGPITKHYKPPTIKDAPGWSWEWQEEQDEREAKRLEREANQEKSEFIKDPAKFTEFLRDGPDVHAAMINYINWQNGQYGVTGIDQKRSHSSGI